jgi:4-hydroxybenzoate polyprenyltransferase
MVLGLGAWPEGAAPFLLLGASACVYHAGMVLNDWADREEDARLGRGRPLETASIDQRAALALGFTLLVLGPLVASLAAWPCGLVLAAVAACALIYDFGGRGAWRGPALLAACRGGNLGAGLTLTSLEAPLHPALLLAPLAYAIYVFFVARVAILEDVAGETGRLRPRVVAMALALCAIGMIACGLALGVAPLRSWLNGVAGGAALLLSLVAAYGLLGASMTQPQAEDHASKARRLAGMGLRRLLVASAALTLGAGTGVAFLTALLILAGFPMSFALRRVFPPT